MQSMILRMSRSVNNDASSLITIRYNYICNLHKRIRYYDIVSCISMTGTDRQDGMDIQPPWFSAQLLAVIEDGWVQGRGFDGCSWRNYNNK